MLFLKILFVSFRDRGREGEGKGEKHQCVVASHAPTTGDLACNPGMCPDWELNQRPFGSQAGAQSTEPHQPGSSFVSEIKFSYVVASWDRGSDTVLLPGVCPMRVERPAPRRSWAHAELAGTSLGSRTLRGYGRETTDRPLMGQMQPRDRLGHPAGSWGSSQADKGQPPVFIPPDTPVLRLEGTEHRLSSSILAELPTL